MRNYFIDLKKEEAKAEQDRKYVETYLSDALFQERAGNAKSAELRLSLAISYEDTARAAEVMAAFYRLATSPEGIGLITAMSYAKEADKYLEDAALAELHGKSYTFTLFYAALDAEKDGDAALSDAAAGRHTYTDKNGTWCRWCGEHVKLSDDGMKLGCPTCDPHAFPSYYFVYPNPKMVSGALH